jgi:hypothetical protein
LRELVVDYLWTVPDQPGVVRQLLDVVAHRWAGRGNVLRLAFDPRSPLAGWLHLPPWQPRAQTLVAVGGPTDPAADGLIYPFQLL